MTITIVPFTGTGYHLTIGAVSLMLTREQFAQLSQRVIDATQAAMLQQPPEKGGA